MVREVEDVGFAVHFDTGGLGRGIQCVGSCVPEHGEYHPQSLHREILNVGVSPISTPPSSWRQPNVRTVDPSFGAVSIGCQSGISASAITSVAAAPSVGDASIREDILLTVD